MKKSPLVLALVVSGLVCQSANAIVVRVSQIVGASTGTLGTTGTGTTEGWQFPQNEITVTNGSGSLVGTNLGLVASAGDRAFVSATANDTQFGCRNLFVAANGQFPNGTETNIYYSFLYRFNDAADISADGEKINVVNRANSGINSGIITGVHWELYARNAGGQIQLGIAKAGNTATNYASTNIGIGDTVFVVLRQHIIPGAQNDVYDLWVNPPPEYFGTNEVDIPPASASTGALTTDGAEDQSSTTGPGRFWVGAGSNAEFDELRVATTWADATPRVGSCVGAAVETSPASVTQSAEISARFQVKALSTATSPTYQWQRSTNGGSSWQTIPGATSTDYTTPNLAANENGSQYRAIVSVACNSSSATSAVATVTLTNPVVSPVGTVMNDTFTDPELGFDDRSNPPLSSTNSLWYTAVTDNLTAFNQGGNMLAIPIAGSSSLWLGYFVETNQPPIHLAVGRAIQVTLPFTPVSFSSFTNNSGLRFGLFDYYDSGNRITADGSNVGGSQGNASGVRGYMLNMNFGTNFNDTTPMEIFARNVLPDLNLMGTTSDYESLASGPAEQVDTNAPAFLAGTQYTLQFLVKRTGANSVEITTTISGSTNLWQTTVTDDNYAYHRFDSFGVRPNSLETTADSFSFPEFIVEVLSVPVSVPPFSITSVEALSPTSVKLTWDSQAGATYHVLSRSSINSGEVTNATILATDAATSYTNSPTSGSETYYRVLGLPYTP